MGIFGNKDKQEIDRLNGVVADLQRELRDCKALMSPEALAYANNQAVINRLQNEIHDLQSQLSMATVQLQDVEKQIRVKRQELIVMDDDILVQEFGLYQPIYKCRTSEEYKKRLDKVRQKQKDMIKNDRAVNANYDFLLNGSKSQGQKMVKDNVKQILRTFNNECETLIDKVNYNNIESIEKRIRKSFDDLNKLNKAMQIEIRHDYLQAKIEELYLCFEYEQKKQEEKEELKRIREEQKEQERIIKEMQEAKKNTEKDKAHFVTALKKIETQIATAKGAPSQDLLDKQRELQAQIQEVDNKLKDIDYRQNNQKAGYVYIISNVGAFGENVYKIGMTRRLDPMERIDELSGASVPFNFDVHALIFSEDAPALESALHKAFENRKVNMMNQRKEFFNVTLDEIKKVVKKNFDKTVEFKTYPDAEQYRQTKALRKSLNYKELPNHTEEFDAVMDTLLDPNDITAVEKEANYKQNMETINFIKQIPHRDIQNGITFPDDANFRIKNTYTIDYSITNPTLVSKIPNNTFLEIQHDKANPDILKVVNLYGEKIGEIRNNQHISTLSYYIDANANMLIKHLKIGNKTFCCVAIY